MIFFKIIVSLIFALISFNVLALNQKPSIAVFVIDQSKDSYSIKLPLISHLNQKGFLTRDGNVYLKKLDNHKQNFQFIIENSDTLSNITKSDLLVIVKLKYSTEYNNSTKISLTSEIYNANTKNFISSWSTPRKIIKYSNSCDLICKNLLISETSILLSNQLGKSIVNILNAQTNHVKNYSKLSNVYNFKLLNFRQKDIIHLTDIMINEFPGFIKISNEESYGKQSTWTYYSSSKLLKLKKWLVITLNELNLKINDDYELIISENNFFINKFPLFNSNGSKGNIKKFN